MKLNYDIFTSKYLYVLYNSRNFLPSLYLKFYIGFIRHYHIITNISLYYGYHSHHKTNNSFKIL
jgi:hypothetical protein